METDKKTLHMNYRKGTTEQIITVDDDFNVPDSKPDIVKKIHEKGRVVIEKVRASDDKVSVSGNLIYALLYKTGSRCACMSGSIPLEEVVMLDGTTPQDIIRCTTSLEDITITVINSRKISVKAVIVVHIISEAMYDKDIVCHMDVDNLQTMNDTVNIMQLISSKKDIFRIRESVNLPSDRPNVEQIIWYDLKTQSLDIRACDGGISIRGELYVFCMYTAENDEEGLYYYDDVIAFSGKTDVAGCTEEMLADVNIAPSEESLIARPDANGELRIMDAEIILDLDIRGYMEKEEEILADAYSPACELELVREEAMYQTFLLKNSVKCRCDNRFKLPADGIMQIIGSSGRTMIEDMIISDNNVVVQGAVIVDVIYIKQDDDDKIGYAKYELPFTENCEISGINSDSICEGHPGPLQVSTILTGGGEIDVKCSATVDLMAVGRRRDSFICDATVSERDNEAIKNMAGITGYITRENDTLWNIAKKYHTTVSDILETNGLASDRVQPKTKLLIVKKC